MTDHLRVHFHVIHIFAIHVSGCDPVHCRCVRPDQSSATVRCHYLTDGTVNFAFTSRRQEFFIPAGLLLKCFLEVGNWALCGARRARCKESSFESWLGWAKI